MIILTSFQSKINHLSNALDATTTDLTDTLNTIEVCKTLTPFRRSTRSKISNDFMPSLLTTLSQLRVDELKYKSIKSTLELDLVVEEKLEARTMKVGLRAAALQSEAMRVRSKAQSMYVTQNVTEDDIAEGEEHSRKLTKKTRSAISLNAPTLGSSMPTTADLSVSNSAATTVSNENIEDTHDVSIATVDVENRERGERENGTRSRCLSEAEEYKAPNYGHISVIKMPDAVRKHARNWSQGGRTSKEIVSPSHPISLNEG